MSTQSSGSAKQPGQQDVDVDEQKAAREDESRDPRTTSDENEGGRELMEAVRTHKDAPPPPQPPATELDEAVADTFPASDPPAQTTKGRAG